jgi:hypothetical protein
MLLCWHGRTLHQLGVERDVSPGATLMGIELVAKDREEPSLEI